MNDKPHSLTRRTAIGAMALVPAATLLPLHVRAQQADGPFQHGVASGDPDATSVVLWTRVTTSGDVTLRCEIARDAGFAEVVATGEVRTGADADHTAKWLATGLAPGGTFYYRFWLDSFASTTGRARTLPTGSLDRLGIALASCSNYAFGHFNAYEAIAYDANVDFVLHTGDYIYEYGQDSWGDTVAQTLGRRHDPAHEIVSLSDYRRRHAQYKTDHGSQAMHAAHSFIACWDDHESANNPWTGGAQNHQPDTEGAWAARREASICAYYEWMPIREPAMLGTAQSREQFWRTYSFGDLATLVTLETRHTARAEQIDYAAWKDRLTSAQAIADFRRNVIGEDGRKMISGECEAALDTALRASVAAHQPWRLLGNAVPMARTDVPDLVALGELPDPFAPNAPYANETALENARNLALKGRAGLPFYPDTWDGYPWARERLYDLSREAGAGDLLVLTGDSHSFWANSLKDAAGRPAGLELGTAGVTSPGDFVESGFGDELSRGLDRAFAAHCPEIDWTDNMHQGYVRLELGRETALATFVAVDTVLDREFRSFILNRLTIAREGGSLAFV